MNNTGKDCSNCFFGVPINATRCKCHVSRPTANSGFPNVLATDYCGYWTDPKTMDRPFFYPIPSATQTLGTALGIQPAKESQNEPEIRPKNRPDR